MGRRLVGSAPDDEPPLVRAARDGDIGLVRELIGAGEPLEAPGSDGLDALETARVLGHEAIVALLRTAGAGDGDAASRSALVLAADRGDEQAVAHLLAACAAVDGTAVDRRGRRFTALHRAALRGHLGVVDLLLAADATVDARVAGGPPPFDRTALHLAVTTGRSEVVERLLAAGADPDLALLPATGPAVTARGLATALGRREIESALAAAGASLAPRTMLRVDLARAQATALGGDQQPARGRLARRRGFHVDDGVGVRVLLAVPAQVDDVARALQQLEGARTWWQDVHGEEAELTERSFAVLRLRGHRWTLVAGLLADASRLDEGAAVRLALALDAPVLRTAASPGRSPGVPADALSYSYFENELCLERMVWRREHELEFESHLRDLASHEIGDPRTVADVFLAELDVWAPHHLGPVGQPGEALDLGLGLDGVEVERLDFVAVW